MLNKAFCSILLRSTFQIVIVCIGVSTPSKIPPPLSCQAPLLKSVNCPSLPFLSNPPSVLVFCEPFLKVGFFSEPQKYQSFSSLTLSYVLKVTKFLVRISQFEFLVMTEKNIFGYNFFFAVKYFRF